MTINSQKVIAAIIPAYNEAQNIGQVLEVLKKALFLDKVLVVDDGSKDATASVAEKAGFEVLKLAKNQGKGAALEAGLKKIKADIYLFIDADLVGLKISHLKNLLKPLLDDPNLDMTVGKFKGGRKITDWAQSIIPTISGQRAITKKLALNLPNLTESGFGVEIIISKFARKNQYKSKEVILNNITQVMKEEKIGLMRGFAHRLKMYRHLIRDSLKR